MFCSTLIALVAVDVQIWSVNVLHVDPCEGAANTAPPPPYHDCARRSVKSKPPNSCSAPSCSDCSGRGAGFADRRLSE